MDLFTSFALALAQVAGLFHDPSIGNAIHIVLIRLILLEEEEVRFQSCFSKLKSKFRKLKLFDCTI